MVVQISKILCPIQLVSSPLPQTLEGQDYMMQTTVLDQTCTLNFSVYYESRIQKVIRFLCSVQEETVFQPTSMCTLNFNYSDSREGEKAS